MEEKLLLFNTCHYMVVYYRTAQGLIYDEHLLQNFQGTENTVTNH